MTDDSFKVNWSHIEPMNYVSSLMDETGVIWLGRTLVITDPRRTFIAKFPLVPPEEIVILFNNTNTLTRQYTIRSCFDWKAFADSCYVLGCKDNKSWRDAEGEKMNLKDWSQNKRNEAKFNRSGNEPFSKDIIFTAYDSNKQKRLIIDGTHRATILTNDCWDKKENIQIQPMHIWECYGSLVLAIFPCDIIQLR
jgi:hypothetical protein